MPSKRGEAAEEPCRYCLSTGKVDIDCDCEEPCGWKGCMVLDAMEESGEMEYLRERGIQF